MTNIISSIEGENSKFLKAEVNTLNQVFKNTYIVPCRKDVLDTDIQNIMVIATDDDLIIKDAKIIDLDQNEIVLTDNYCPVDTLIPQ